MLDGIQQQAQHGDRALVAQHSQAQNLATRVIEQSGHGLWPRRHDPGFGEVQRLYPQQPSSGIDAMHVTFRIRQDVPVLL